MESMGESGSQLKIKELSRAYLKFAWTSHDRADEQSHEETLVFTRQ